MDNIENVWPIVGALLTGAGVLLATTVTIMWALLHRYLDTRFSGMDAKMDAKFEGINQRFDDTNKSIDQLREDYRQTQAALTGLLSQRDATHMPGSSRYRKPAEVTQAKVSGSMPWEFDIVSD